MDELAKDLSTDIDDQLIILTAGRHDLKALKTLLRIGSANVQDPDTGLTPLHAAVASCETQIPSSPLPNLDDGGQDSRVPENNRNNAIHHVSEDCGQSSGLRGRENGCFGDSPMESQIDPREIDGKDKIEAAVKTVQFLLQNGAIWNDLDNNNETPGCMARRLKLTELYDIMVDAGVRAELLLSRLDRFELLRDDDDDNNEDEEKRRGEVRSDEIEAHVESGKPDLASGAVSGSEQVAAYGGISQTAVDGEITNMGYLKSDLLFSAGRLLDQDTNGIMMAWETDIMRKTADLLVPANGMRILNIGYGLGIVDSFFHTKSPSLHHIIEAHPTVLKQMKKDGWADKPGVTIHDGRWQDVIPKLIEEDILFDAIYFDTFAEEYQALREFLTEYVIGLLDEGGRWGFFHGLGADRQICYDVYTKVVEMDLFEAGYDVEWETIRIPDLDDLKEWEGVRRKYWVLDDYKLPVCTSIR